MASLRSIFEEGEKKEFYRDLMKRDKVWPNCLPLFSKRDSGMF
jgi:hypothetical protein